MNGSHDRWTGADYVAVVCLVGIAAVAAFTAWALLA